MRGVVPVVDSVAPTSMILKMDSMCVKSPIAFSKVRLYIALPHQGHTVKLGLTAVSAYGKLTSPCMAWRKPGAAGSEVYFLGSPNGASSRARPTPASFTSSVLLTHRTALEMTSWW